MLAVLDANGTAYKLLVLVHLFSVIVGIGSTFVYPFFGAEAGKRKGLVAAAISETSQKTGKIITTPFIYLAGLSGVAMVAFGPHEWSEFWVQAALTLFVIAVLFAALVHVPNLDKMVELGRELVGMGAPPAAGASGPPPQAIEIEQRGKAAARNGGILHLLITAIIVLMVFKPR